MPLVSLLDPNIIIRRGGKGLREIEYLHIGYILPRLTPFVLNPGQPWTGPIFAREMGEDGCYYLCQPLYGRWTKVLLSTARELDGNFWLHLSVSMWAGNDHKRNELPPWEKMVEIKRLFLGDDTTCQMIIPPTDQHRSILEVHHIWLCLTQDVTPDFTWGGPTI